MEANKKGCDLNETMLLYIINYLMAGAGADRESFTRCVQILFARLDIRLH